MRRGDQPVVYRLRWVSRERDAAGRAAAAGPAGGPTPAARGGDAGRRRRRVAARLMRFLAAICALCGVAAFPASAVFDIRSVAVRGNAAVPAAEILRRAGVGPGDSVFRVNAHEIRARLRADPRLEDASVSLAFPRRLVISVRERTPVAALPVGDGYVLLAANGVAIAAAPSAGPYPVLRVGRLGAPVEPGAAVQDPGVRLGAGVAGSLPQALRADVAEIQVDAGEAVLETRDGIAVRVGGADGIASRLAMAPDVLAAVRSRGMRVEYVDLRFPGSVIVKPSEAAGSQAGDPARGAAPAPRIPATRSPRAR